VLVRGANISSTEGTRTGALKGERYPLPTGDGALCTTDPPLTKLTVYMYMYVCMSAPPQKMFLQITCRKGEVSCIFLSQFSTFCQTAERDDQKAGKACSTPARGGV